MKRRPMKLCLDILDPETSSEKVDAVHLKYKDGTVEEFGRVVKGTACKCGEHQETIDELQRLVDTYRASLFGFKSPERELADARFKLHAEFEFPENLHLADVIEKYVMRELYDLRKADCAKFGLKKETAFGQPDGRTVPCKPGESPDPNPNEVFQPPQDSDIVQPDHGTQSDD